MIEGDLSYSSFKEVEDIPHALLTCLRHFFESYKVAPAGASGVQKKTVIIPQTYGADEARATIQDALDDFKDYAKEHELDLP